METIVNIGGTDYVLHTFNSVGEFEFVVNAPEPSTFALLGMGVVGLAIRKRRRRSAA